MYSTRQTRVLGCLRKRSTEAWIATSEFYNVHPGRLADSASDDDMEGAELWNALADDLSLVVKDGGRYGSRVSTTSSRNRVVRL